jgi:NAD(P)-dependent dehydrogenase (short-subunit alcohol dehydrogenase family)
LPNGRATLFQGPHRRFFADRARTPGDIDILVNNAGISMFGPTPEVDLAAYDKMFASNVRAPLFLVGALAPGLVERGRRSIISLSSMAGGVGLAGGAAYGATKASLEAMTRGLAGRVQRRVSAVAPEPVYTPTPLGRRVHHRVGGDDADAPRIAARGDRRGHRVPRVFTPSYITGATIAVDGGRRAV